MHKKILAVILSGMLVFGAGMSVFAADAAESEAAAAATDEGSLDALLGGLMNSLGSEEGSLDDILSSLGSEEGSLDELLSSLGGEEGGTNAMLGMLLGSLGSEEGSLDSLLGSVLGGLSGDETEGGGFGLGLDLSKGDLAGIVEALSDPETSEMLSGLLAKDGPGTMILDLISSEDNAIGTVLGALKSEDGGYDIEKVIKSLEGAEEKEDSIVIDGTEISAEEINEAITGVLGMLGLSEEGETEAA